MKSLSAFLITVLFLFSFTALSAPLEVRIQSVHDGDTLTVVGLADGKRYKVRLMGVDAPEVDFNNQSQGDAAFKARDLLSTLAPAQALATLSEDSETDKFGRILGRVIVNGTDVNKELLRQGWGYVYFIYPFNKRIVSDYIEVAREAYEQRRGVFSGDYQNLEEPYQFRMTVKNHVGRNPVGDFTTKKLFNAADLVQVPVWSRVFFPSSDIALRNGYSF